MKPRIFDVTVCRATVSLTIACLRMNPYVSTVREAFYPVAHRPELVRVQVTTTLGTNELAELVGHVQAIVSPSNTTHCITLALTKEELMAFFADESN